MAQEILKGTLDLRSKYCFSISLVNGSETALSMLDWLQLHHCLTKTS